MKIGLFISSLFKYDAMGNDVLMMYKILKEENLDVIIFAQDYDKSIDVNIKHINEATNFLSQKENIAIYHHGVYTDFFDSIANANCKKIFRYHNITNSKLFEGYDENAVKICYMGREQMNDKVNKFNYFLSCSKFNNYELINDYNIENRKTFILPPFHRIEEWDKIEEDIEFREQNIDRNKTNILTVGRLSPNKNHQTIVRSFADYLNNYDNNAILHIVGKRGPLKYYEELISLISKLKIESNVKLYTQGLEENKLKTMYKHADIGLICSKHEGFCVPIVEFMYFGIPIVSSSFTALKETVDKYGILIDKNEPIEFSVALKYAKLYKNYLSYISKIGYERYKYEKLKRNFIDFIKFIAEE